MSSQFVENVCLSLFVWTGPERSRAQQVRVSFIDFLMIGVGAALPWSTTITSVLCVLLVIAISPSITARPIAADSRLPLLAPVLLFLLAAGGMFWATDVPWNDRLHALDKLIKLLLIPLVFLHFRISIRPAWIFLSFAISNFLLLILSFSTYLSPELAAIIGQRGIGAPIRNYIDQSQAFSFLAVIIFGLAAEMQRKAKHSASFALYAVALSFLANLAIVNVARSAFLYIPVMLALFAWRYWDARRLLYVLGAMVAISAALLVAPSNLQRKLARIPGDLTAFRDNSMKVGDDPASGAQRLVFWENSLEFVRSAPWIGHGTGSTKELFEHQAQGKTGLESIIVSNPHNQTLSAAIQWGVVGCVMLWTMWLAHLNLFRGCLAYSPAGFAAWIGLIGVAQNIASSTLNSHIQDFYPGWIYVFVVGAAGGCLCRLENERGS